MTVFVRLTGEDFNLGDTALRRAMLREIASEVPVHAFVKDHAADYVEALGLRAGDVAYADEGAFAGALRAQVARGPIVLLEKPGAFKGAHRFGRDWHRKAARAARVRAAGGAVLWLGGGIQAPPTLRQRAIMRLHARLADSVIWRDTGSADWFGCGEVMPDWAFALPPQGCAGGTRRTLGISLRAGRAAPPDGWVRALARYCEEAGLEPVAISQVRIDDAPACALAARLGCAAIIWGEERSHLAQEAIVRDAYAGCALVVSDRLHVLVLALTEGAVPCCLLPSSEDKIARHFAAIGARGIAADVSALEEDALVAAFGRAARRSDELRGLSDAARGAVQAIGRDARALIAARCGRGS